MTGIETFRSFMKKRTEINEENLAFVGKQIENIKHFTLLMSGHIAYMKKTGLFHCSIFFSHEQY